MSFANLKLLLLNFHEFIVLVRPLKVWFHRFASLVLFEIFQNFTLLRGCGSIMFMKCLLKRYIRFGDFQLTSRTITGKTVNLRLLLDYCVVLSSTYFDLAEIWSFSAFSHICFLVSVCCSVQLTFFAPLRLSRLSRFLWIQIIKFRYNFDRSIYTGEFPNLLLFSSFSMESETAWKTFQYT